MAGLQLHAGRRTPIRSLNRLASLRKLLAGIRRRWLRLACGVECHPSASLSLSARIVPGRRGAVRIGKQSLVAFKTLLIARDADGAIRPIRVGDHCFVGGGAVILPGVEVGDGAIVAAGAVVHHDVPPRTIVGGNPARILREDVVTGAYGVLLEPAASALATSKPPA